jgi:hypothetical protein
MDTVRCPSCKRWLALPEESWGQAAQCPGCRTIFTPRLEAMPADGGSPEGRIQAGEPESGDEERVREFRVGSPRKHRRRRKGRSAGALEIGRPEKITFWIGFFLGILEALTLGDGQSVIGRVFLSPLYGMLSGLLFFVVHIFLRHAPRASKLILLGIFLVGTFGLMLLFFLNLAEWSVANVLFVAAASLVGGGFLSVVGCFICNIFFQISRLPTLLAFAAEPDVLPDKPASEKGVCSREVNSAISSQNAGLSSAGPRRNGSHEQDADE